MGKRARRSRLMMILVLIATILLCVGINDAIAGSTVWPISPTSTPSNPNPHVQGNSITFTWQGSPGPAFGQYGLCVGVGNSWQPVTDSSPGSYYFDNNYYVPTNRFYCEWVGSATSKTLPGFPNDGTQYSWHVDLYDAYWDYVNNLWDYHAYNDAPYWVFINSVPPPGTFNLTSPTPNGVNVPGSSVTVRWSSAADATTYYVTAAFDSVFSQAQTFLPRHEVGNITSFPLIGLPDDGSDIYWKVEAKNSSGSSYSTPEYLYFVNGYLPSPGAFNLTWPRDGASETGTSICFAWDAASNATEYNLQVCDVTGALCDSNTITDGSTGACFSNFGDDGRTYTWYVTASNSAGSTQSATYTFVNSPSMKPETPLLSYPGNGAPVTGANVWFAWEQTAGATLYHLEVFNADSTRVVDVSTSQLYSSDFNSTFKDDGSAYTWQVTAENQAGSSTSLTWNFTNGDAKCTPTTGTGLGVFGDTRTINTCKISAVEYRLQDKGRPCVITTEDAHGSSVDSIMTTVDNIWTDQYNLPPCENVDGLAGICAGVDAHFHAGQFYDYLLNKWQWKSYDNNYSPMTTIINYSGETNRAHYIGEGVVIISKNAFDPISKIQPVPYAGSLSVLGHEWGHAVEDANNALKNYSSAAPIPWEDGIISEAFGDWFGIAFEQKINGWTSWIFKYSVNPDRNLADPTQTIRRADLEFFKHGQPVIYGKNADGTYKDPRWGDLDNCVPGGIYKTDPNYNDACYTHWNNGPANKMFYLLSVGGQFNGVTVQPLGIDTAIDIAFKANRYYWPPDHTFYNAYDGMAKAAHDNYGAYATMQVMNAWAAVGVTDLPIIKTSVSPAGAGTTSGDGSYSWGTSVTLTATPNADYDFVNWTNAGMPVSTSAGYPFEVTGSVDLVANFAKNVQELCATLIMPDLGNYDVGETQTELVTVTNYGSPLLSIESSYFTGDTDFTIKSGDDGCSGQSLAYNQTCTIRVTFAPTSVGVKSAVLKILSNDPNSPSSTVLTGGGVAQATITATAGSGGTISPTGAVYIVGHGTQTFTITPNPGYHVVDVKVDNVSKGAIASYTLSNVIGDHTISASFDINRYLITATAAVGGTISPSGGVPVNYGGNQTFTITPNPGWYILDVVVDGISQAPITSNPYSFPFSNVTANHTITASFSNSPASPTNLTAIAASNTQINLTWLDNSNTETAFLIERKTGSSVAYAQVATVAANTTSYQDQGLNPNTTYTYRVRADGIGTSGYTNEATATTLRGGGRDHIDIITTVAGNGTPAYSGDNGPAISASLYYPQGVAVDSSGNIFIADYYNHRIRKVNTSGTITTVAGNGTAGYSGDNGPAATAGLNTPGGVAVDSAGNLYIADTRNHRIRKVNTSGTITTVAGNGTPAYSGDNGPATSASLYYPFGVAVDSSGEIYIADEFNHRIRRVNPSGTIITVAGNGTATYSGDNGPATSASLYYPIGVTVDSSGNIYIADQYNNRIRKVNASGTITTVAGNGAGGYSGDNGPATSARLTYPEGVAVDSTGDLYIADSGNHRIRKVTSGTITTVAGNGTPAYSGDNGPATSASLYFPLGVTVDLSGNIFIADYYNSRVRMVTSSIYSCIGQLDGTFCNDNNACTTNDVCSNGTCAGTPIICNDNNTCTTDTCNTATGCVYTPKSCDDNNACTTDTCNPATGTCTHTAVVCNDNNACTTDTCNTATGCVYTPIDCNDNNACTTDSCNPTTGVCVYTLLNQNEITTVAGNGTMGYSGDNGPATSASLYNAEGVAVDSSGNIYIADYGNSRIRKVNTSGTITTVAGNGTAGYSGDNGPATSASINYPTGVAVDSSGNIYIADYGNSRIRKVNTSGTITTVAGNGTAGYSGDNGPAISANLNRPIGVAVDSSGNIYIADSYNQRIRKVATSGTITTVAGNGTAGYSGDNGPATSASLNHPIGVTVDSSGNICIADYGNHRIRKVNTSGTITTVAGNGTAGYSGDNGPAISASVNPTGVAVDLSGNIYIADYSNSRVRMVTSHSCLCTGQPDGTFCNDNNTCTTNDVCSNGTCAGTPLINMASCNDNNLCTDNDVCSNVTCSGTPKDCDDHNVCTTDSCLAATGTCVHTPIPLCVPLTVTVNKAGAGAGTVSSSPNGIYCGAYCAAEFGQNSSVVLTAIPDTGSLFAGWTGDCSGIGNCPLVMNSDKQVSAIFTFTSCSTLPVRIKKSGGTYIYYPSIQKAYDAAVNGDVIQSLAMDFAENLNANHDIAITLAGGFDCGFNSVVDFTSLLGITTTAGTLTISDVEIESAMPNYISTLTSSAGSGGNISPSGTVNVYQGASQSYTITANAGSRILDVFVDGVSVGAVSSYSFTNITADHTIIASFETETFTITATAGSGGTIAPSGAVTINYGSSQTFSITPSTGYQTTDVQVDSVSVGAVTTYTFTNVTVSHTISANFAVPPPSNLTATVVSSTQANLSWTYNSTNETGFAIERKTDVVGAYAQIDTVPVNVTAYNDTSLVTNAIYYYRVRAYNSIDYSTYSNVVSVTTGSACIANSDVNGDGVVDSGDVVLAQRISMGVVAATSAQLCRGDISPAGAPDGIINAADVVVIQRKAMGLQ